MQHIHDLVMRTRKPIHYRIEGGREVIIPVGTKVERALNLPDGSETEYWVGEWEGMDEYAESHARTYGFGISTRELINGNE